jgi:hypothetical protein
MSLRRCAGWGMWRGFAVHAFFYEMVALTPRCAMELGYAVSPEDQARPYIEVSGRKGFGVKADDLIDRLIAASRRRSMRGIRS